MCNCCCCCCNCIFSPFHAQKVIPKATALFKLCHPLVISSIGSLFIAPAGCPVAVQPEVAGSTGVHHLTEEVAKVIHP